MDAKTWLRWVAVLPVAILGVIAANFILHWILIATLNSETIQIDSAAIAKAERLLLPFAAGAAFISAGAYAAPSRKMIVAAILGAVLAVAWGLYFLLRSS